MTEVGFARRVAPAVVLALAGGFLLYLLPTNTDNDTDTTGSLGKFTTKPSKGAHGGQVQIIEGDAVNFRYGTVQVKIALDGTKITDIAAISAPGGSYQGYTDRAIPGMRTEILAAQSTNVAAVSGATYTSEAYAESVQSALDKA